MLHHQKHKIYYTAVQSSGARLYRVFCALWLLMSGFREFRVGYA